MRTHPKLLLDVGVPVELGNLTNHLGVQNKRSLRHASPNERFGSILQGVFDTTPVSSQKIVDRNAEASQVRVRESLLQLFKHAEDDDELWHVGPRRLRLDEQGFDYSDRLLDPEALPQDDRVEMCLPKNEGGVGTACSTAREAARDVESRRDDNLAQARVDDDVERLPGGGTVALLALATIEFQIPLHRLVVLSCRTLRERIGYST